MAENPHSLEKDIKGIFNANDLTGKAEGGIVDRIVQFKHELSTGTASNLYIYDKMIKSYYKQLDNLGITGFQTDEIDAGFNPKTITGFFDNKVNTALFDFFSKDNEGFFYSMRKINADYTGYACRIRRQFDNALASVEFDSNGIVSTGSKVTVLENEEGFGLGFKGTETWANDGRTGTLDDFIFPMSRASQYDTHHHNAGMINIYPQRMDTDTGINVAKSLTGQADTDAFKLQFGNLYDVSYDNDFVNVIFKIASGIRSSNGHSYGVDGHTHPIWSGEQAGNTFWFYKHRFADDSITPGFRWVLVKNATPTHNDSTLSALDPAAILRAYGPALESNDRNRPYTSTATWVLREPGEITADELPRETLSYNRIASVGPLESYSVASLDRTPTVKRNDGSDQILCNSGHVSGSILTPLYGYLGVGGSRMIISEVLRNTTGSLMMVVKAPGIFVPGIQTFYSAGVLQNDNHAAIYGNTSYFMKFGHNGVDDYATKGLIKAPIVSNDLDGDGTIEANEYFISGGDFGTGVFNQYPADYQFIEMHNNAPLDSTTGANRVYFNDVEATFVDADDGSPASFKETGNLGTFHYFGMDIATNDDYLSFGGEIAEVMMFKTDPKDTEGERRRFASGITSFYGITGGQS